MNHPNSRDDWEPGEIDTMDTDPAEAPWRCSFCGRDVESVYVFEDEFKDVLWVCPPCSTGKARL